MVGIILSLALLTFVGCSANEPPRMRSVTISNLNNQEYYFYQERLFLKSFSNEYYIRKNQHPPLGALMTVSGAYVTQSQVGRNVLNLRKNGITATKEPATNQHNANYQLIITYQCKGYTSDNACNYMNSYIDSYRQIAGTFPSQSQIADATSYFYTQTAMGANDIRLLERAQSSTLFTNNPDAQIAYARALGRAEELGRASGSLPSSQNSPREPVIQTPQDYRTSNSQTEVIDANSNQIETAKGPEESINESTDSTFENADLGGFESVDSMVDFEVASDEQWDL